MNMTRRHLCTIPVLVIANMVALGACSSLSPDASETDTVPVDRQDNLNGAAATPQPAPASSSGIDALQLGNKENDQAAGVDGVASGTAIKAMLVLGHWSEEGRKARAILACKLIKDTSLVFDRIVVSGGCKWGRCGPDTNPADGTPDGCYTSQAKTACGPLEAEDLRDKLVAICGVSPDTIVPENNSANTVENYCNSQQYLNDLGSGSSLYVLSSHYHAFSVSACYKNLLPSVAVSYYYTCDDNSNPPTQIYTRKPGTPGGPTDPSQARACCNKSEIGECNGGKVISPDNVTSPICSGPAPTPTNTPGSAYPCHKDYNGLAYNCVNGQACK